MRAEIVELESGLPLSIYDGKTYEQAPAGDGVCVGCVGDEDENLCKSLSTSRCAPDFIFKLAPVRPIQTTKEAPIAGRKDDTGKTQYSLVPPFALEAVASLLTDGLVKYEERDNWHKVPNAQERYLDALLRHLEAFRRGENRDPDAVNKDTLHLTAVAVNALFLIEFLLNPKFKNNPEIKQLPEENE